MNTLKPIRITSVHQLTDGQTVLLTFPGLPPNIPAIVHKPSDMDPCTGLPEVMSAWLCFDSPGEETPNTTYCPNMHGKTSAFFVTSHTPDGLFATPRVPVIETDKKIKNQLKKSHIAFVRNLIQTADKAKELGVYAAFSKVIDHVRKDTVAMVATPDKSMLCQPGAGSPEETNPDTLDTYVTYATCPENTYKTGSRTITTFGRFIRRAVGISQTEISDAHLLLLRDAYLVEKTRRTAGKEQDAGVVLLTGEALRNAYVNKTGISSCMTGSSNAHRLGLYVQNPNKVALLVYTSPSHPGRIARALLWTLDDGRRLLDRIYPESVQLRTEIQEWCGRHAVLARGPRGELPTDVGPALTVTLDISNVGPSEYPYLDTLRWGAGVNADNLILSSNSDHVVASLPFTHHKRDGAPETLTIRYRTSFSANRYGDPNEGIECQLCKHLRPLKQANPSFISVSKVSMGTAHWVEGDPTGIPVCESCAKWYTSTCGICGTPLKGAGIPVLGLENEICSKCASESSPTAPRECTLCGALWTPTALRDYKTKSQHHSLCPVCAGVRKYKICSCGDLYDPAKGKKCSKCRNKTPVKRTVKRTVKKKEPVSRGNPEVAKNTEGLNSTTPHRKRGVRVNLT